MANPTYQFLVYGCTEWGIYAAIRMARLGIKTAILMDAKHVGGFTSGGLSPTDVGRPSRRLKALYKEHYVKCGLTIGVTGNRNPEPNIAERNYLNMLGDAGVRLYTGCQVDTVAYDASTGISTLTMIDSRVFVCTGDVYDASVCMDVLQRRGTKGVHWTIGREADTTFNETLAGANKWFKVTNKVPYIPGTTTLYPQISPNPKAAPGSADDNVQAYFFREVHSLAANDRIAYDRTKIGGVLVKDINYDRNNHLCRAPSGAGGWISAGIGAGKFGRNGDAMILGSDKKPLHRLYPLMNYTDRAAFEAQLKLFQMQQWYFNLTDPSLNGTDFRAEIENCGVPRTDFRDNNYFPYALYARETIRPIGQYIMTQYDTSITDTTQTRNVFKSNGVAIGGYSMDQHASIWFQSSETSFTFDASFGDNSDHNTYKQGYGIPITSLYNNDLPGLLFGYPSCSHIAWSTIRIVLNLCLAAEACALMAYQHIVNGTPYASIDVTALRAQLTDLGLLVDPIPITEDPDDTDVGNDPDDPDDTGNTNPDDTDDDDDGG